MTRVAVVGSINTDFVVRSSAFPRPGETIIGESFATYGGGKGANQAIAAARLGATVEFFGAIGQDAQSLERLEDLRADGVGTENISRVAGYGGVAIIEVESSSGQNSIILVPGANSAVSQEQVEPTLRTWCAPGDVFCQQLEIPLDTVTVVLALGVERGALNVLNAAPYDQRVVDMLGMVDDLIVNEIEAGQLLGVGSISVHDAPRVAASLRQKGVRHSVVITLGSLGAWLNDGNVNQLFPTREVPVVDTTGAGDAFCGAFCAWITRGATRIEATRAAVFAGTLAVQRHGAQPSLPSLAEVQSLLNAP